MSAIAATGGSQGDPFSSISSRAKRNGMFFDEETSDGVTKSVDTWLGSSRRQRVTSAL